MPRSRHVLNRYGIRAGPASRVRTSPGGPGVVENADVTELPAAAKDWVASVLPGHRLVRADWLTGGRDHANHAVTVVDRGGRETRYVLRRWVRRDWRQKDPGYTVAREQAALELLATVGAATPRLVAADPTGESADVPALLMTFLAGGPPPPRLSDVDSTVRELSAAANASLGCADQDVGHMRWNLAVSYGYEVAEAFRRAASPDYDRYWDVRVIVDLIDDLSPGETIGPYLPDLGGDIPPADRVAVLERLLREALP